MSSTRMASLNSRRLRTSRALLPADGDAHDVMARSPRRRPSARRRWRSPAGPVPERTPSPGHRGRGSAAAGTWPAPRRRRRRRPRPAANRERGRHDVADRALELVATGRSGRPACRGRRRSGRRGCLRSSGSAPRPRGGGWCRGAARRRWGRSPPGQRADDRRDRRAGDRAGGRPGTVAAPAVTTIPTGSSRGTTLLPRVAARGRLRLRPPSNRTRPTARSTAGCEQVAEAAVGVEHAEARRPSASPADSSARMLGSPQPPRRPTRRRCRATGISAREVRTSGMVTRPGSRRESRPGCTVTARPACELVAALRPLLGGDGVADVVLPHAVDLEVAQRRRPPRGGRASPSPAGCGGCGG